ncbi:phosphotransferase family protein [Bauldia sp.]|uniref:phosphotransferase family protein n=1 Tax=Bauldia sp. TaxID=2575872 RepID=UPI003BAAF8F5
MAAETLGPLLAAGNIADVHAYNDGVVKLYRGQNTKRVVFREAAIHAAVEEFGLPVPSVRGVRQIDGRWGVLFDRIEDRPLAQRMIDDPAGRPAYLEGLARLHTEIHSHPVPQFVSFKRRLAGAIDRAAALTPQQMRDALRHLAARPDGDRLCHGDFHPENVLGDVTRPTIIDWPDACRGDPAADVCRSYLLLTLHAEPIAEPYLDAYCRVSGWSRDRVLDWLPTIAAARLAEDIAGERDRLMAFATARRTTAATP